MNDKVGRLLGIAGSTERDPTLAAIDRAFGIQGARTPADPPREMAKGEAIEGEIVDVQFGQDGQVNYVVECENGDFVNVPQAADMDLEKGDTIEAERTEQGYEVSQERGMER